MPVDPFYERDGGLAFDLLSSCSGQGRVTIGHANGVITIDLIETPRISYRDASTSDILADWQWLSLLLNRVNHAMGRDGVYPFTINEAVRVKLDFVHRVVQDVASRRSGQPVLACPPATHS